MCSFCSYCERAHANRACSDACTCSTLAIISALSSSRSSDTCCTATRIAASCVRNVTISSLISEICHRTRLRLGFGKPPLFESRPRAFARLDIEVPAGWTCPSSRGLWGDSALLLPLRRNPKGICPYVRLTSSPTWRSSGGGLGAGFPARMRRRSSGRVSVQGAADDKLRRPEHLNHDASDAPRQTHAQLDRAQTRIDHPRGGAQWPRCVPCGSRTAASACPR